LEKGGDMQFTNLDMFSVFTLLFLGNLTIVCILATHTISPEKIRQYRQFMAGKFLQALGWLLFLFRGDIPDIMGVQAASSLLFAGFALETIAVINTDRMHRTAEKVYLLLGGAGILMVWLTMGFAENVRVTLSSVILIVLFLPCAGYLLYYHDGSRLKIGLGFLYGVICASGLYCAISALKSYASEYTLFSSNLSQTAEFLFLFLVLIVSGTGFLLLLKEYYDQSLLDSHQQQNQMNKRIQESEAFNRELMENLPDYVIVYGLDERLLYVNPAMISGLGYPSQDVLNRPLLSVVAEEYKEMVSKNIITRISGKNPAPYEIDLLTVDNKKRTVILKGSRIRYEKKEAVLILFTDITERKLAETRMKENKEKFEMIFQKNMDALLLLDSAYGVIEGNKSFERIFQYRNEPVTGLHLDTLETGLTSHFIGMMMRDSPVDDKVIMKQMELKNRVGSHILADIGISRVVINSEPGLLIQIHPVPAGK
jgi:PAS domain S-box-containing protein